MISPPITTMASGREMNAPPPVKPSAIGVGHHGRHGDAAFGRQFRTRLHTDEPPAVADQRESRMLHRTGVRDRVPPWLGVGCEVASEATDELLVMVAGQTGHLPAPLSGERDEVTPDRAGGAGDPAEFGFTHDPTLRTVTDPAHRR